MYLMTKMTCPTDKLDDVLAKYAELLEKYPVEGNVAKPVFPGGVFSDSEGYHAVGLLDVPAGKMEIVVSNLYKQMNEFFMKIDGFLFELKPLLAVEETIGTVQRQ